MSFFKFSRVLEIEFAHRVSTSTSTFRPQCMSPSCPPTRKGFLNEAIRGSRSNGRTFKLVSQPFVNRVRGKVSAVWPARCTELVEAHLLEK